MKTSNPMRLGEPYVEGDEMQPPSLWEAILIGAFMLGGVVWFALDLMANGLNAI